RFDPRHLSEYPASDWERNGSNARLSGSRELIVGIELNGASAAYSLASLRLQNPMNTKIGSAPILIVVDKDGNSVRSFARPEIAGNALEFYRRPEDSAMIDNATGSVWSFSGQAVSGSLAGRQLAPIQNTKDYWFDWIRYHPDTTLWDRRP